MILKEEKLCSSKDFFLNLFFAVRFGQGGKRESITGNKTLRHIANNIS